MTDPRVSDIADGYHPAADARALGALQFPDVLAHVAGYASTPLGAAHVRGLVPRAVLRGDTDAHVTIVEQHSRVAGMRRLMGTEAGWPSPAIPDLSGAIARLALDGSTWSGQQLRDLIVLLDGSRGQQAALGRARKNGVDIAALEALSVMLISDAALAQSLDKIVDEEGQLRDGASPELRRLRKQLRGAQGDLVKLLERLMAKIESQHRVDDGSVTMRNGRWVIPVRREGRGAIGGIVHDTSSSGATVFVEPPAAVEFGNRIRELQLAEASETAKVLADTTAALRPRSSELARCLDAMIEFDSLVARARFAVRFGCAPARLQAPTDGLTILEGRHPLLLAQDAARVVPFDLAMSPAERTLLVSGPNTGGKTVLLKAIALLSLMAQAGIPATVGRETALPLYDRVFADIGDEQSIEASLSTFSGHVKNLVEVVDAATADSLVLVDELGSGTDPNEGAALGAAILEALTRRGTATVATTHLGALKELAHETPGVVNASLQFDEAALAPTYRLLTGIPGRSYGLSIARRLRMPDGILVRAEARVPDTERTVAALIEDLERRQQAIAERERLAAERDACDAARHDRLGEREAQVRLRERDIEREAREAAKRYVLDARKEIEAVIATLQKSAGSDAGVGAASADARTAAERLLARERAELRKLESDQTERADLVDPATVIVVGDYVAIVALGGTTARVIEARGDELVVALGSLKTTVTAGAVRRVSKQRADVRELVPGGGGAPEIAAKMEIDLRGMRIGELDAAVQVAVDNAVRADLPALRIIHGKGTGALRERVGDLLSNDPRVRSFRLGAWNEGGAGVTVAELS